jgi:UDP-glucose:(heptosyl)LPS alpha-1,3-glucosyltransferase
VALFSRAAARTVSGVELDVVHSMTRTLHQDIYFAGGGSHADYMLCQYSPLGRKLRRVSPRHALQLAMERRVFADPAQIVQCNSEMVARQIHARYGVPYQRIVVIHNGVELERFQRERNARAAARLRDELKAGQTLIWVFAGSGFPRKGLDTALRALARGGPPDAQLWVLGRDNVAPWRQLARELGVDGRVRFLGYRRDPEVVFAAADALILPTQYDSFATVCLEAAASEVPVVTSGSNGAGEFIKSAGRIVADPRDVDGFAAALDELADATLRRSLGQEGRRLAEACGWDAHVSALRALYSRVVRDRQQAIA